MKPCLFSVSYAGLWGQSNLSLSEFVTRAAHLGYPSVMLMGKRPHLSPLDMNEERLLEMRHALESANVHCDVVGAYTNLRQAGSPEVPEIEMQIAYVEAIARVGAALGARIVRVFTAYDTDASEFQRVYARVVSSLREMCDRAASSGMTIAVQNHHDIAVDTDALIDLLGEIDRPNCKLGFDAWSPALRGEDLYESARKAAPFTALTTNADYIRVARYRYRPDLINYERQLTDWVRAVQFGAGHIDYDAFFQGLAEGGFDGIAAYEICSPVAGGGSLENLDTKAAAYLEWMRQRHLLNKYSL